MLQRIVFIFALMVTACSFAQSGRPVDRVLAGQKLDGDTAFRVAYDEKSGYYLFLGGD